MGRKEINIEKYVSEVKKNIKLNLSDDLIEKDLILTLILAEFQKQDDVFNDLIFKGGTLLSRNYLRYHRFSEDLDFVYPDSGKLRLLSRKNREREIKSFIDIFVPRLKEVADILNLDFSTDRRDQKYCSILSGRTVYTFRLYYSKERYVKVEINFIEKLINNPVKLSIKTITDFFDSKELMFILGLKIENFRILSYPVKEIILEKYRALLTRDSLFERDLFDLFLMPASLDVNLSQVVDKIKSSMLIKKQIKSLIESKLKGLLEERFFASTERILDLAIIKYDEKEFNGFKEKIKPILIKICKRFLEIE